MSVGARPTISNVSMTSKDTEYSASIPSSARRFEIKLRALNALLKLSFTSGASGTTYVTIPYGASYVENNIKGGMTLYFQSPTASQTAEVKYWV